MQRKVAINENGRRIGEDHPKANLTDEQVERMRDLREYHNLTYDQLAAMYQVPKSTVASICQYMRRAQPPFGWKRLPPATEHS